MVGPMMLFKMLHCKHFQIAMTTGHGTSRENKSKFNENLCRVCLQTGSISIYDNENIRDAINVICGVYISFNDPYPKSLCQSCHSAIQNALLLRKTAQSSDEILKQPLEDPEDHTVNNDVTDFDDNLYSYDDYEPLKTPSNKKTRDYFCKKCNMEFKTCSDYIDHRISDEHDNMRYTCPVCNKSYRAEYYKKHLATHNQDPPYMCEFCGKKFNVQGHFARHRLTHFYNLPYKCGLCPYKGRFRESLKMHMRTHTGEKPYQCSQCPSRFINKSNLNKHMLTHRGQHDYKCDSCGRGFYTKRELEMHFKVDHTGIKDHICSICGKAFGYRKQMMKHQLKVHKREKLKSGRTPLYVKVELMKQKGEDIALD